MSMPLWFVSILKKIYPARDYFANMTKLPILREIVDFTLFRGDRIIYLPKDDLINPENQQEGFENVVLPSEIINYFIMKAKFLWIMDFCICRQGEDCTSYPKELGCLFMGEAVLKINPNLGRLVSKEEALNHVARCREAGLVHMIGRNRLDSVWLGAGPSQDLLTVCNCCPCCCLWRMIPNLTPRISSKVSGMPGLRVYITDDCVGCGECTQDICFVDAIKLIESTAVITEECRGCGRCIEVCPNGAIIMDGLNPTNIDKTIEMIDPLVFID